TRTRTQDRDEFGAIGTSEGEESLRKCGRNPADRGCKHGKQAGDEYASLRLPRALCKSDELTLCHDSADPRGRNYCPSMMCANCDRAASQSLGFSLQLTGPIK